MTVRTAEFLMASIMALASVGLMWKSTQGLNIGWVEGSGLGSGAWPFWLSAGMLLCCLWTLYRWFTKVTPESVNTEPFMSATAVKVVGMALGSLLLLVIGTHIVGVYFSMMVFLFIFLRIIGGNSWKITISLMILSPVAIFGFFEWALKMSLPKAFSEPLFYPIYDLMY